MRRRSFLSGLLALPALTLFPRSVVPAAEPPSEVIHVPEWDADVRVRRLYRGPSPLWDDANDLSDPVGDIERMVRNVRRNVGSPVYYSPATMLVRVLGDVKTGDWLVVGDDGMMRRLEREAERRAIVGLAQRVEYDIINGVTTAEVSLL